MLRSLLIYMSKLDWMRRMIMGWGIARSVALRFVAGESLEEAIEAVKVLNQKGINVTMDQLGEFIDSEEAARKMGRDIIAILEAIYQANVRSSVSLKLTQIGLGISQDLCAEILKEILSRAKELDNFVRIDMEDSPCVDATLEIFWQMKREYGFANVGMELQSYLYRAEQDTKHLLAENVTSRMVKGAYKEPEDVAFPDKKDVDKNFDHLMTLMMDAAAQPENPGISQDGRWPPIPAAGTHDEKRIDFTKEYAHKIGLPKEKLEIQMLYGIRRDYQESLVAEGYPVRVYVPFGTQWYPYFMRRLAERPANLWFFIGSLLRN